MLCALIGALAALATPLPPAVIEPSTAPPVANPATLSEAVDASDLEAARGGESPTVTVSAQTLSGVSGGNSVNAGTVSTGGVTIGAGAFSGFNGLGNFVVNTGNNNVVQGALSVSISMPTTH